MTSYGKRAAHFRVTFLSRSLSLIRVLLEQSLSLLLPFGSLLFVAGRNGEQKKQKYTLASSYAVFRSSRQEKRPDTKNLPRKTLEYLKRADIGNVLEILV